MVEERTYTASAALRDRRAFGRQVRRDLAIIPHASWRLFVRTTQARFRQSALRWLWLVMPPIVTTLTWVFLGDAGVINFGDTAVPYAAYVAVGTVTWQLFVECLSAPLRTLEAATGVLKFARLPHEAWVVAGLLDALLNLAIRITLAAVLCLAVGSIGGWTLLLVPLTLTGVAVLGLALGMLLAVIGRLYSDVGQALTVVTGIWFFVTPVVYPRPSNGYAAGIVDLNPVTPLVVSTRAWLTGTSGATPVASVAVVGGAAVLLLATSTLYRLAQPHLVERM